MKKLLGILVLGLLWCGSANTSEDINLSCAMTNWNEREDRTKAYGEIKYTELKPSHFSAIIEITSPGKVIVRLIGTSQTGYMHSPYVGTIDDNKIKMNHKMDKLSERGTDLTIDLISGLFEQEIYILNEKYWWLQKTGTCAAVK